MFVLKELSKADRVQTPGSGGLLRASSVRLRAHACAETGVPEMGDVGVGKVLDAYFGSMVIVGNGLATRMKELELVEQ